jgi:hypothetical protein
VVARHGRSSDHAAGELVVCGKVRTVERMGRFQCPVVTVSILARMVRTADPAKAGASTLRSTTPLRKEQAGGGCQHQSESGGFGDDDDAGGAGVEIDSFTIERAVGDTAIVQEIGGEIVVGVLIRAGACAVGVFNTLVLAGKSVGVE